MKQSAASLKRNLEVGKNADTPFDWKQHDEISYKIEMFNIEVGAKYWDRWTYEKLSKNASNKLNLSYEDAWKLGVDELIKNAK